MTIRGLRVLAVAVRSMRHENANVDLHHFGAEALGAADGAVNGRLTTLTAQRRECHTGDAGAEHFPLQIPRHADVRCQQHQRG